MPAIANLTINDGTADQLYSPKTTNGSIAKWTSDAEADTLALVPTLSVEHRTGGTKDAANRILVGFGAPVADTVDAYAVHHLNSAQIIFNFSQKSTYAERQNLRERVISFLGKADVEDSVDNFRPFY